MNNRLNTLRRALGLSLDEMARLLGLSGHNAADKLREIERGAREATGPMQAMAEYLEQAADTVESPNEQETLRRVLPRWLDCTNLEDEDDDTEIVMRTRYPRCYAIFMEQLDDSRLRAGLDAGNVDVIDFPPDLGLPPAAIVWIDTPVRDPAPIYAELIALKIRQAEADLNG